MPTDLAIAVFPHLIPASTIPNGLVEQALSQPLAEGRDEVLYIVCSHPRVSLGLRQADANYPLLIAAGRPGGGIAWSADTWWGRAILPPHVVPSKIPWAIIDDALDWAEHLPSVDADLSDDPDGDAAQNRQELLPWVYDRHLDLLDPPPVTRGDVDGGLIDLRLEYVGSSGRDALRRPAGAHHKVPTVLGRILLYEPHRLVYLLACEIRIAFYDADEQQGSFTALRINDAVETRGVQRELLIAAAEDALIAAVGAPYNKRNTGRRRFPRSAAGVRLGELGVRRVKLAFYGLPPNVLLTGADRSWSLDTPAVTFELDRPREA